MPSSESNPTSSNVEYLIFDVEAIADGDLISKVRYSGLDLSADEAIAAYREELIEKTGKDVIPTTFMLPISVAVAKVTADFEILDLTTLDAPKYRPSEITKRFWQGWSHYNQPTLVTFNGRGYDLPVLEMAAYRYGLSVPAWFNISAKNWEQSRNRYNVGSHFDMMDLFSNFNASRVTGGLNLLAQLIGKPGKTGIDGSQVQDMYDAGEVNAINDYCRCDVLDTYFVFLRSQVMLGKLDLDREQEIVGQTKHWLEGQTDDSPAYEHYLQHWGDWHPPE